MKKHIALMTAVVLAWILSGSICLAADDVANRPSKREGRAGKERPHVRHKALAALIESFKLADDKAL